jgi:hypothetical protein
MKAFVDKVTISYLPLQKSDSFLSAVLSAAVFYCDPSFCILIQWLRENFKFVHRYGCMDRRLRSNTLLAISHGIKKWIMREVQDDGSKVSKSTAL